jgi:hypothetical protein
VLSYSRASRRLCHRFRFTFATDVDGTHLISAHNVPSGLAVQYILPEGIVDEGAPQTAGLDFGIYCG